MVEVGENETIESALRRFRKKVERDGIIREIKRRMYYEKPSEIRKKKKQALKRKLARRRQRNK